MPLHLNSQSPMQPAPCLSSKRRRKLGPPRGDQTSGTISMWPSCVVALRDLARGPESVRVPLRGGKR